MFVWRRRSQPQLFASLLAGVNHICSSASFCLCAATRLFILPLERALLIAINNYCLADDIYVCMGGRYGENETIVDEGCHGAISSADVKKRVVHSGVIFE